MRGNGDGCLRWRGLIWCCQDRRLLVRRREAGRSTDAGEGHVLLHGRGRAVVVLTVVLKGHIARCRHCAVLVLGRDAIIWLRCVGHVAGVHGAHVRLVILRQVLVRWPPTTASSRPVAHVHARWAARKGALYVLSSRKMRSAHAAGAGLPRVRVPVRPPTGVALINPSATVEVDRLYRATGPRAAWRSRRSKSAGRVLPGCRVELDTSDGRWTGSTSAAGERARTTREQPLGARVRRGRRGGEQGRWSRYRAGKRSKPARRDQNDVGPSRADDVLGCYPRGRKKYKIYLMAHGRCLEITLAALLVPNLTHQGRRPPSGSCALSAKPNRGGSEWSGQLDPPFGLSSGKRANSHAMLLLTVMDALPWIT